MTPVAGPPVPQPTRSRWVGERRLEVEPTTLPQPRAPFSATALFVVGLLTLGLALLEVPAGAWLTLGTLTAGIGMILVGDVYLKRMTGAHGVLNFTDTGVRYRARGTPADQERIAGREVLKSLIVDEVRSSRGILSFELVLHLEGEGLPETVVLDARSSWQAAREIARDYAGKIGIELTDLTGDGEPG